MNVIVSQITSIIVPYLEECFLPGLNTIISRYYILQNSFLISFEILNY